MSGTTVVGTVELLATIDTSNYTDGRDNIVDANKDIEDSVRDTGDEIVKSGDKSFSSFARSASDAFGSVADGLAEVLKGGLTLAAAGTFGLGAAAKAAFDQVGAVQQATIALKAYEPNAQKVSDVLQGLVKYAQSDLGVLFNRKDLFESAQSLKLMGDNTDELVQHVQILSRSVGLGLSNWEDLDQIVGRVGSTGRLTGIDFDNLTKAGYKLSPSLRNTNITFDQLFKALDKGIPTNALEGQANTIQGIQIRLQTAFRGIGNAFLGVNASTNEFIKGGLGDQFVGLLSTITQLFKDPSLVAGVTKLGSALGDIFTTGIKVLIEGFTLLVNNLDIVGAALAGVTTAFVVARTAAILFDLAAEVNPIYLFATAVAVLVAGLTFLQIQFGYVTKGLDILKPSFVAIKDNIEAIINRFQVFGKVTDTVTSNIPTTIQVVHGIRDALVLLNEAILATGSGLKTFVKSAISLYKAFTQLTPIIIIGQFFTQVLLPGIEAVGAALVQNLLPAFKQLLDSVVRLWNAVNPALIDALKIIGAIIGGALLVATWAFVAALNIAVQTIAIVISVLSNLIDWMSNVISWFGNLVGAIVNFVGEVVGIISNLIPAFNDLATFIISVFATIDAYLIGKFVSAVNGIKNAFKDVGAFFLGIVGTIVGMFANVGSAIGSAISGAFTSVVNTVLKGVFALINGFLKDINTVVKTINKIPGIPNLGYLSYLDVPQLATGGIVSSPTLAMIGEGSEPEAVVPLSKLDAMMSGSNGGNSSNSSITINLSGIMTRSQSDLRATGKILVEAINQELRAKQQPQIGGGKVALG